MSLVDEEVVLCPFFLLVTVWFLPQGVPSYLFSIREKKAFSTKLNSFLLSDRKYLQPCATAHPHGPGELHRYQFLFH